MKNNGNWVFTPAVYSLVYQYAYDKRKCVTEKKIPGANPVYMVYDNNSNMVKDENKDIAMVQTIKSNKKF